MALKPTLKIAALAALTAGAGLGAAPASASIQNYLSFSGETQDFKYVGTTSGGTFFTGTGSSEAYIPVSVSTPYSALGVLDSSDFEIEMTDTVAPPSTSLLQSTYESNDVALDTIGTGTFSVEYTGATTVVGSSLTITHDEVILAGTFSGGKFGSFQVPSSDASYQSSTLAADTVTFTSNIFDFSTSVGRDVTASIGSITPTISFEPGGKDLLKSFKGTLTGGFGSDPEPLLPVPEPASWALMIVGMGGVGAMMRRRKTVLAA